MIPNTPQRFAAVSPRLLERYLCQDVSTEEARVVEAAMAASPELAAHVQARQAGQSAFRQLRPFSPIQARVEKSRAAWFRRLPVLLSFAAVPAAAALLVGVFVLRTSDTPEVLVRTRGGVNASLVIKRGESVFDYDAGATLRAGDLLRLRVDDPNGGYLYALSLDARGSVQVLLDGVSAGPGVTLSPRSWRVDATPVPEALYVVLSVQPKSAAELTDWLRSAARGDFPPRPLPPEGSRTAILELRKDLP